MGNAPSIDEPWAPVLDAVNADLTTWRKVHSTLEGRRLVVNAFVGGRTQFLAKAQGMPKHIEQALVKMVRNFIWDDNAHPPISMDTLYLPKTHGGMQLMDLPTRTKAIEATWLRPYLDFSAARPIWAWVADAIFAAHISVSSGHLEPPTTINTFLQNWDVALTSTLPPDLSRLLKTARDLHSGGTSPSPDRTTATALGMRATASSTATMLVLLATFAPLPRSVATICRAHGPTIPSNTAPATHAKPSVKDGTANTLTDALSKPNVS
ncbi:hypothetical protein EIP86_001236 [Pleurotus ostreatoroseus]|nr:hypothetical protein EIP86_001236 [Pleurotus ostreatoroseus]